MTIATYTIGTKELEGVIFCFPAHNGFSVPVIHRTFKTVYGIDLYETNFHLIFKDVATNGLTELYKDEPEHLLAYTVTHIKYEFGVTTRTETGGIVNFKQGQELATRIRHYIRHQRLDVLAKCLETLVSTSRIFQSLVVGVVDELYMDKLFSEKQAVPITISTITTARNHLASIVTTMLTAVTGLTSQAAVNHTHTDREETIDYKDIPTDVQEQRDLENHPVKII